MQTGTSKKVSFKKKINSDSFKNNLKNVLKIKKIEKENHEAPIDDEKEMPIETKTTKKTSRELAGQPSGAVQDDNRPRG